MEKFEFSEIYRKYLTGIESEIGCLFAVWGLDITNDGEDKFLVKDQKVILFRSLDNIKIRITEFKSYFFDENNFEKWLNDESFNQAYSSIKVNALINLSRDNLKDKDFLLSVLNSLNIIQDFFIQINRNNLLSLYDLEEIKELKEFVYSNHFWKNDNGLTKNNLPEINRLSDVLVEIYRGFFANTLIIG